MVVTDDSEARVPDQITIDAPPGVVHRAECPNCQADIEPDEELPYTCSECDQTFCPFCWQVVAADDGNVIEPCEHVLASGTNEENLWFLSPFGDEDLPRPEPSREDRTWSLQQKTEAFGDLLPVLEAFDGLDVDVLDILIERLKLPVLSSFRTYSNIEFDYFARDVPAARALLSRAVEELGEASQRLSQMEPSEPCE
jgi:hypothetical protein